jgi:predicted transcriptional regulator
MMELPAPNRTQDDILRMTADIVAAFVRFNQTAAGEVGEIISAVHGTLRRLQDGEVEASEPAESLKPAVPVRKSIAPEYLICLEDGKKLKMLKRYLRTTYNMSPEEYRAKWGLPAEYPMVAPNYAAQRSAFAKQIGLGRMAKNGQGA